MSGQRKIDNQVRFFQLIGLSEFRAIAMTLPEVEEGPAVHAARRIAALKEAGQSLVGVGKGGGTMTISLSEQEAKAVAAEHPADCERSGAMEIHLWALAETYPGWLLARCAH